MPPLDSPPARGYATWLLALAALALVGGCQGTLLDPPSGPSDAPRDPSDPGTPRDPGDPADPSDPGRVACETEQPGPPLLRLLTRAEYAATVADLLFIPAPDVDRLPVETSVGGYDNDATRAVITDRHGDELAAMAASLATQVEISRISRCTALSEECTREMVQRFGLRAFRRPLSEEEVERYRTLFDPSVSAGDFAIGARLVVEAMLQSASFLYRSEVGEPQADGTRLLSSHEVASAMSYLFWGSMPDDALFALAEADVLRDPTRIEEEARAMLEDVRSQDAMAAFFSRWLGTTRIAGTNKDAALFPAFTSAVRESMIEEERRFVLGVLFGSGRYRDLFSSPTLPLDANLRAFYGAGSGGSGAFESVAAPQGRGLGVLSLGSVMASHAHSNESSPIRRGLFVRDRMLCQDLPPPPADADTTPPGLDPTLTTRERFARHTSAASCRTCHQYIDGVGFSFERFDAVGAYREREHGLPIDTSGQLIGPAGLTDPSIIELSGPEDLAAMLQSSERAEACFAEHWWQWSRGASPEPADRCAVESLGEEMIASGGDLRAVMVAALAQESFLRRRER